MPYSTYLKNSWLYALRGSAYSVTTVYASLHTADPGDTGASEVAGGTPAYARKSITFAAAAAGAIDSSSQPVFDVPASTTVTHVGFWDAVAAGNFLGSADVADEVFGGQGTYTLTDADLDVNA